MISTVQGLIALFCLVVLFIAGERRWGMPVALLVVYLVLAVGIIINLGFAYVDLLGRHELMRGLALGG